MRIYYRRKTGNEFGMDESLSVQMVRRKKWNLIEKSNVIFGVQDGIEVLE